MMALVSPWLMAMGRNAAAIACRSGMPNDTFDAPSVMFTPNSALSSAIVSRVRAGCRVSAPTGMASGSMTMSSTGILYFSVATPMSLRASSTRRAGSSGISSSSFGRPITAAPYFFTSGRIASSRSSSAVTELTSALPWYAARPASSTSMMEESMTSGRSVSFWISVTARLIRAASSASGAPMFTSSSMAPPATCSLTSISTRDRSPLRSCSWKIFRPVGLIRSPMIANGWSSPIRTVLVAEDRMVCTGVFPSGVCIS